MLDGRNMWQRSGFPIVESFVRFLVQRKHMMFELAKSGFIVGYFGAGVFDEVQKVLYETFLCVVGQRCANLCG